MFFKGLIASSLCLLQSFAAAEETKGPNPNPTDAVEKPATVALETPKAAVEAGLNPGVLALSMKASESKTKSVNMHLPKDSVPPKADILFAFDLTGSMGDELANAKVNSQNIMNNLTDLVADINFGVVSFMDYPDYYESCDYYGSYGSEWSGDYPYSRDQALTDSTLSVKGAINGLTLGSGNDGPESYSRVLYETFADSSIGWRSGSKKIVIMWGDALPHDCDVYSCTGDSPAWWYYEGSTGADPGRDGVVDTADDLAIIDVMNGMAAEKITLIMLYSGGDWDETGAGLWDCLASMTGGQAFEINYDGTIPGGAEIPEYLANKIDDEIKVIDEFTMEVCEEDEATFSSWLSNVNPAVHGPINIGIAAADISFDLTISVPSTAVVDEVYEFDICALGDGVEYDRLPCQITIGDNVVVPPPTDPPSRSKKGCFSADATTQVMDRGEVPMKDLVLGDEVLVGNGFEPVYGFGHYNRSEVQSYLQLKAGGDCGTTLEMTDDHLLYVQKDNVVTAIAAGSVKPGDIVVTGDAKTCPITKITKTQKIGTFMPLTKSGNIVVNGILASSYVSIVATAPNVVHQPLIDGWLSEHGLLHLWLTPYRMYCMGVSSQGCSLPAGEKGILKYLLFGETLAKFGNEQSFMVQVMMGVPILALFGSLYALEAMFGAALAPLALLLGAGCLVRRGKASAEKVKTV